MTGTGGQSSYMLKDRLRSRFGDRGSEISGIRATSTSELMHRAEMGRNPRENCAQQAFDESYMRRSSSKSNNGNYHNNRTTYNTTTTEAKKAGSPSAKNTARASSSSRANEKRRTEYSSAASAAQNRTKKAGGNSASSSREKQRRREEAMRIEPAVEMRAAKHAFPVKFVSFVVIGTVMVLALVMNFSEVYRSNNRNDGYVDMIAELENEAEIVELALEEKNDMKYIEEVATKKLGMAKEDSLQRKYISLSDGERIDVVEVPEEEGEGGVMLSSFFASLTKFLERFK